MPLLYEQFLTDVILAGTRDVVIPVAETMEHAAAVLDGLGLRADLVRLQARDEDAVRRGLRLYWRLVAPGGALMGDGYSRAEHPDIVRAVEEFAAGHGTGVEVENDAWLLRKPAPAPGVLEADSPPAAPA
jgi:hypothetical protein